MKYLITWAWELDGHAGASSILCSSQAQVKSYLLECLKGEDGILMGKITSTHEENENTTVYYGSWECGDFAISVTKFKTFNSILGKEMFARTG